MNQHLAYGKRNILRVLPSRPYGGLQRIALIIAREQRRSGHDVKVLLAYREKDIYDFAINIGMSDSIEFFERADFWRLGRVISNYGSAIIHCHLGLIWTLASIRLWKRQQPVVMHAHLYAPETTSAKVRLWKRLLRSLDATVIAVSDDVARNWKDAGLVGKASRIHRVYNGLEAPSTCCDPTGGGLRFGMATRIDRSKGVFEFLDAARAIHQRLPEAHFILAGEGPDSAELEATARRYGLSDRVKQLGFVSDIDVFWRDEVDVALFTSPQEACPLRLLEPLFHGKPVAAFRTGSGADEIIDRCRGIVAVPWGDYEAFASAAIRIALDREERERLGREGRADIEANFSLESMMSGIERVYEMLR